MCVCLVFAGSIGIPSFYMHSSYSRRPDIFWLLFSGVIRKEPVTLSRIRFSSSSTLDFTECQYFTFD